MKKKRLLGLVIAGLGMVMIFFSMYIMNQVDQGREQIADAQRKVDKSSGLFGSNPVGQFIGGQIKGAAEKKIRAGTAEADYYQQVAGWLKIGGIFFLVVGGAVFLMNRRAA